MNEEERGRQVALATKGDPDALQRLIIEYHGQLSGVVGARMDPGSRRFLDLDDVLQEAYAAAFKGISGCRFQGPAAFYGWLEKIAINRLTDAQRALKSRKRDVGRMLTDPGRSRTSYPELINRLPAPDGTPSRHVAKDEAVAAVVSSLARLTDDQREVVRLRFLEDLSVAEVAAQMGKTEAAVHMLCHRALSALRELMASITHYLTNL